MKKKIGTHNGTFHCDEALACALLNHTNQFKNSEIVRSRDSSVLDECDIVVDVGGIYDDKKCRYDHHQRGFTETFDDNHNIKLSSAGLIYKHYGREVIKNITNEMNNDVIELIYQKLYDNFIQGIDAIDNGISQYDTTELKPLYKIRTDLSSRVGYLNPSWTETDSDIDERFQRAVKLTGDEFRDALNRLYNDWLPGREIVLEAMNKRFDVHKSGQIVKFEKFAPWKSHLHLLEEELGIQGSIIYVLYTDWSGKWRVQCVPVDPQSFQSRLPLPEEWRGLRDDELSNKISIPQCIFVHAAGFIGGNHTYDGAYQMAVKALEEVSDPAIKKQKV